MKNIAIILALAFTGCAGQNIYIPVSTVGRDKQGNPTAGVKSVPLMKNTGNLTNANLAYAGPFGRVSFTADAIDNASATMAMHEGINKTVRAGGSVLGTVMMGIAGIAAIQGATEASVAATNASASKHAASEATKQATVAARAGVVKEAIGAKAGVVNHAISAGVKKHGINAAQAVILGR